MAKKKGGSEWWKAPERWSWVDPVEEVVKEVRKPIKKIERTFSFPEGSILFFGIVALMIWLYSKGTKGK